MFEQCSSISSILDTSGSYAVLPKHNILSKCIYAYGLFLKFRKNGKSKQCSSEINHIVHTMLAYTYM